MRPYAIAILALHLFNAYVSVAATQSAAGIQHTAKARVLAAKQAAIVGSIVGGPALSSTSATLFSQSSQSEHHRKPPTKLRRRTPTAPGLPDASPSTVQAHRQQHAEEGSAPKHGLTPPPLPTPPPQPAAARDPPWLHLLSEQQRAEYAAALPDALAFQKDGLTHPARRAEYLAAAAAAPADPDGRARAETTLARQHAAYNVYSRLAARGRRLLQKVKQGRPPLDRDQPPWLRFVSAQQQREYRAVWADAMAFQNEGLADPRRRAEYLAAPDPKGKRAKRLARLQAARNTYSRLARLGRRHMLKAEQDQLQAQAPPPSESLPIERAGDEATGAGLASEKAVGDGELGGENRLYHLSQLTSGRNGSPGPVGLAHAVLTRATTSFVRKAHIYKSAGQYARPESLAKVVRQALSRARLLQLGPPGRVLRPR